MKVPTGQAVEWFEESLGQGFDLSAAALAAGLVDRGSFFAIVPEGFTPKRFDFAAGGVTKTNPAQAKLCQCLCQLQRAGGKSVIVEDDVQRRSDPHVSSSPTSISFCGERVIHWADLPGNEEAVVVTIDRGATGYPLNAFVTTRSSTALGLTRHESIPDGFVDEVFEGLIAVICAAFDGESYVLWTDRLDGFT